MTEKIRIVYFITSLEGGGTERQLALMLEGLPDVSYEKHIVCLSGLGPLQDKFAEVSASITDLKYPRLRHNGRFVWKNLPSTVTSVMKLVRILKKLRPDILHTLIPVCNVMGSIAGKLAGVPVIVCSRLSLGNYRDSNVIFAKLENFTDRFFTLFHCKSEGIKDDVMRREPVDPDLLRVIYNGTKLENYSPAFDKEPLRESLGLRQNEPLVGMVANLRPYKGHHDVVSAMPLVLRNHPRTQFLFVGRDDGVKQELQGLAVSLGVAEHLHFTGERHDVPKLLQLMTLLVSASHEEGFSNTIIEAMAAGLPVVATRVGGNIEQVADGITGYLVEPHSPKEIAEAVNELLDDPALAQKMGRHGNLRVARNFSHKAVTEQIKEFYRDAIELES
jgi:glycosyltransferase involved in cell wall biosynthesis